MDSNEQGQSLMDWKIEIKIYKTKTNFSNFINFLGFNDKLVSRISSIHLCNGTILTHEKSKSVHNGIFEGSESH